MGIFLTPPPDVRQPVVIYQDGGGLVRQYQEAAFRYNAENRRVEIRGSCRSSCTLALSVKNVCVGKGAEVKWHHAFNADDHTPRYDVTREMLSQIPFKIAQTVQPYISINYNPQATLNYSQLLQLGIPDCDGYNPTVQASVTPLPPTPTQPTREQILGAVGYKTGAEQYAANTATSAAAQIEADPEEQKRVEFDAAYTNALTISTRQHGAPATTRNCNKGNCEEIAAYYDKKGVYTELHRNTYSGNRVICRLSQEGIFEDTYSCVNWLTGERSRWNWSRDPLY